MRPRLWFDVGPTRADLFRKWFNRTSTLHVKPEYATADAEKIRLKPKAWREWWQRSDRRAS